MDNVKRNSLAIFPIIVLLGGLVALAGSQGSVRVGTVPVFAAVVGVAFVMQWLVFVPAYVQQTERFYDLTGSVTYLAAIGLALYGSVANGTLGARALLVAALVCVWALRLGTFLFGRIRRAGRDDRFDDIKPDFLRFLNAWTMQGLWVCVTAAAALAVITSTEHHALDAFAWIGALLWAFGFGFEVIADEQKRRFAADAANAGQFIRTGLWARSRHPNYFGEIVLWCGVAVIAVPVLRGWQWVTMLSPLFVLWLLTRVSGVPLLEAKADKKWGGQEDYEAYKRETPVLIPRL